MIFKAEIVLDALEWTMGELKNREQSMIDRILKDKNSGVMGWLRKIFKKPFTENSIRPIHLPGNWIAVRGDLAYCKSLYKSYKQLKELGWEDFLIIEPTLSILDLKGDCLSCKHYTGWSIQPKCWYVVPKAGAGWTCCEWENK